MRSALLLSLLLGAAFAAPVRAQTPALPIALPPGAVVQAEMDGQDGDLLGMVKSLLAGAVTPKTEAGADANPFLALLGDGQLAALIKDIHHLHVVSFKPASEAGAAPLDLLAFYEKPFEAEGGHRLLYVSGSNPLVMVGFDQPHGFAAVGQSSGTVYVVRSDGYPDLTVVGTLLRTFGSALPTSGLLGALSPPAPPVTPAPPAPPAHKVVPKKASHKKAL